MKTASPLRYVYRLRKRQENLCKNNADNKGFIYCKDCKNKDKYYLCTGVITPNKSLEFCICYKPKQT